MTKKDTTSIAISLGVGTGIALLFWWLGAKRKLLTEVSPVDVKWETNE